MRTFAGRPWLPLTVTLFVLAAAAGCSSSAPTPSAQNSSAQSSSAPNASAASSRAGTAGRSVGSPATASPLTSAVPGAPAGASSTGPTTALSTAATGAGQSGGQVVLVTHDSFAVAKSTLADFEKTTGITVKIETEGDAGALTNKLVLTKNAPLGDVEFGIDNTFASRALAAGILQPYTSPAASGGANRFAIPGADQLTAVDYGDVCVNVDHNYFTAHKLAEPTSYEDLAKPAYKDLLVVESPATSSPGLAFLLGTISHFSDGWTSYWKSLVANGVKVDSGWDDAWSVDFSGADGHGDRPLVVSYSSSPPDEVKNGVATIGALLNTCFRQVEYAGVLAGAKNPSGAEKFVDFLLSKEFQSQVAEEMYVYPVQKAATIPADWQKFAPVAPHPASLTPARIAAGRDGWISQWSDVMGQ